MGNVLLAVEVLTELLSQAQQVASLIQAAQATGQDITGAQLDQLSASYQSAKAKLDADIAAAKAAGK